jgi:nitrogen fixation NifU-like protein
MLTGATLEEAAAITPQAITAALDGLPPHRLHSAALAAAALRKALALHRSRQGEGG